MPDYVFIDVMGPHREYDETLWERLYNTPAENFRTGGGQVHVDRHLKWKKIVELKFGQKPVVDFDILSLQRKFYTKFVSADGIAIVANKTVEDLTMLKAREAVSTGSCPTRPACGTTCSTSEVWRSC